MGKWEGQFFFSFFLYIEEVTLQPRLTSNSEIHRSLPPQYIKDLHYHTWMVWLLLIHDHDNYFMLDREFSTETTDSNFELPV